MLAFSTSTTSQADDWNSPYKRFDANKNFTNKSEITWIAVDNPAKVCEQEGRKRFSNFKGFNYVPQACAIWEDNKCLIITKKRPNMHELGHEVRHCFQGHWHD